ncbi:hypothetical protein CALCODRAFT_496291 [Calocera cornea HHB12733]|uniref:Uncharacterized protein n=1 Tax=Calocera cornea HHB12733 TaxID=1353952 RepID=A0A165FXD1_9BASI|nr:hypothetical protein CALCODRAFT_496291 [Calocera cornea HHB12733]
MHRALRLQEILDCVVPHLANSDVAVLARVASIFFQPCITRLYGDCNQATLKKVFRIMYPDEGYHLRYDTSAQMSARLRLYCSCVRKVYDITIEKRATMALPLSSDCMETSMLHDLGLWIQKDAGLTCVFPRLHTLHLALADDSSLPLAQVLLSPVLYQLVLFFRKTEHALGHIGPFCNSLVRTSPNLGKVMVFGRVFKHGVDYNRLFDGLKYLRDLHHLDIPADGCGLVSYLDDNNSLDALGLMLRPESSLPPLTLFRGLRQLRLRGSLERICAVVEAAEFDNLTVFMLSVEDPTHVELMRRINTALVRKVPRLTDYTFSLVGNRETRATTDVPAVEDFSSLCQLERLETLDVYLRPYGWQIDNSPGKHDSILRSFSRISTLRTLNWYWRLKPQALASPGVLVDLARNCPALEAVWLPVDLRMPPSAEGLPSQHVLRSLLLNGASVVDQARLVEAELFLLSLFPNACMDDFKALCRPIDNVFLALGLQLPV